MNPEGLSPSLIASTNFLAFLTLFTSIKRALFISTVFCMGVCHGPECKMQNDKCKVQNGKSRKDQWCLQFVNFQFSFFIYHFALA